MKRQSLLFLISLILGILFCYFLKIEKTFKILFVIVLIFTDFLAYFLKCNKKFIYFLSFFCLGFVVTLFNKTESSLNKCLDENVSIVADIMSSDITSNGNYKYEIYINSIDEKSVKEKSLLFTENDSLKIGDNISFKGKLKALKYTNPNLFNFKRYSLKNKIFTRVYSDKIKILGESKDFFLKLKRDFNLYIQNVFDSSLNEENSNIMKRIFLSSKFDNAFDDEIRNIGISHILAVSGLHIGIIYFLLNKFLLLFPIKRLAREFLILLFIFFYGSLIGNPASVIRAEVFLTLIILTKFSFKIVDRLNTLFLTAFIVLLIQPFMIFDIGFYLSISSVFAIINILPRFYNKKEGFVFKSLKLTFSILLVILPIILYAFGSISVLTFIANLVLVPVFVFCIVFAVFLLFVGLLSLKITSFFAILLNFVLDIIRVNVGFLNEINLNLYFENFKIHFVFFYYFLIYIYLNKNKFKALSFESKKFLSLSILLTIFLTNLIAFYKNETQINFIDIGQGDACLIRNSNKNILIDTGGINFGKGDNGKTVLVPYLKKNGVKRLDYVFISHLDSDHCKNLKILSENIDIKNLIFRKNGYENYIKKYGNVKAKNIINIENEEKIFIGNIEVKVFQVINSLSENDKSIILNLKINGKKILFTGDIGFFTENQILKKDIDCDYLKVAHHGSKYSSSDEFLKASSPKAEIISCGYKNRYGHPHKDSLDRISKLNNNIFRTDLNGNIILKINRFEEKIVGFNEMDDNLIKIFDFYFEDIFFILSYLLSFIFLVVIRRDYELHTSIETFRPWRT